MWISTQKVSISPQPCQHLSVFKKKKNGHSDMCEMISLPGFDLHFPDD